MSFLQGLKNIALSSGTPRAPVPPQDTSGIDGGGSRTAGMLDVMFENVAEVKVSPGGSVGGASAVFCCSVFDPQGVCGHPIGSGGTVCLEVLGSCTTKAHQGAKRSNLPPAPHIGIR